MFMGPHFPWNFRTEHRFRRDLGAAVNIVDIPGPQHR